MKRFRKKICRRIGITAISLCIGAVVLSVLCSGKSGGAVMLEQGENEPHQGRALPQQTMIAASEKELISLSRSDGTVDELTMEDYLVGVLAAEVSPQFHEEALKAQAIAARTYTKLKYQSGQPICDDYRCCQAYDDEARRKENWKENFESYEARLREAVSATAGMVLCYDGQLAKTFFHSTCGGKTASAEEVWGTAYPYLISVDCPWDTDAPRYQETVEFSVAEANACLNDGITVCSASSDEVPIVESQTDSGRAEKISYGGKQWKGTDFRQKLGLNSTNFSFSMKDGVLTISTVGYGHGVGLCQHGANGMGKEGYSAEEILSHYYPGCYLEMQSE